jgi:hypothetical protein
LIWELAAGQPYLTQLLGFQLVRRYNDQVFEHNQQRDPQFAAEDVQAVVEQPEFFNQGKQYFLGVWSQANDQNIPGQHELLKTLAPHAKGLDVSQLLQESGLDEETFNLALQALEHHDVVRRDGGWWHRTHHRRAVPSLAGGALRFVGVVFITKECQVPSSPP